MINFALEEMTPILAIFPVSRHVEVGQVTSWQTSPTSGGIEWESIDPCNQHSFGVAVTLKLPNSRPGVTSFFNHWETACGKFMGRSKITRRAVASRVSVGPNWCYFAFGKTG